MTPKKPSQAALNDHVEMEENSEGDEEVAKNDIEVTPADSCGTNFSQLSRIIYRMPCSVLLTSKLTLEA